ncbi:DUF732 domain-containing protein [Mycobacteroides abscessus]|uniref:DUF732 domain-containing protein n=1 Tax=Mycobacteroides abscessus TaxID=36809 RepID=UPI0009281DB6|nr:DUF732 domain-containing protein [Mycobacteroides abscessus]SHP52806.1 Bacteriophage protein [Mycobacteroides abscessus subsp. abscessus]
MLNLKAVTAGLATVVALISAPSAHADRVDDYVAAYGQDAICPVLDEYPTNAGILGIVNHLVDSEGFTSYSAGLVIAHSVILFCPQHVPVLRKFADTYNGTRSV